MSKYTVETLEGCKIIRGEVPLGDMAALMQQAPEGAVMDLRLASRIGAVMVFGAPAELDRLRARNLPPSPERQAQVAAARAAGLEPAAVAWVEDGDRGRSSETLFSVLTGVVLRSPQQYAAPSDASDFGRCRQLLEAAPSLLGQFDRMGEVSPEWRGLVQAWSQLSSVMDEEAPEWRSGGGDLTKTNAAMRAALKPAGQAKAGRAP